MPIPDDEVAQVRAAADLVALVSDHVALRQQGQRWVGLCPFHNEKTPSFGVNPQQGFYYCFGCQASGDAISFVRATEHLDFADAVRMLAERFGVVLHETEEGGAEPKRRGELFDAVARAVAWYHERLLSAPDAGRARDYLRSRGYGGETVRMFKLGWAPEGWDALSQALGVPQKSLVDSGLAFVNRAGRLQDAFRARVLFPIFDPSGRPVALGGRILPAGSSSPSMPSGRARASAGEPKYKNSPETPIYSKRRVLYGLNWAKQEIVATGEIVVCEGYTDVIGCFEAGIRRAVATCGTALAEEHFRLLRNFGRRVVLAYDADQAGQSAIGRVYEWERRHEVDVRVASLPSGSDPAELARSDPLALRAAVEEAVPFLQFRVNRALSGSDLSTPEGRAKAAELALAAVAEHPDALVQDPYVMRIADLTRLDPALLRDRLAVVSRSPATGARVGDRRAAGHARAGSPAAAEAAMSRSRRGSGAGGSSAPAPTPTPTPTETMRTPGAVALRDRRAAPLAGSPTPMLSVRPGLEALRLAVHRPELVADRLEDVLFADELQRRAFKALASADDVRGAVLQSEGEDPEVAALLRRLTVEEPTVPADVQGNPADDVVAVLVREAARRVLADRQAAARVGQVDLAGLATETATVRRWMEELDDPERHRATADLLVAWLTGRGAATQ